MLTINGKSIPFQEPISLADYLNIHQYQQNRIAIELNGSILPKSAYSSTWLKDNDKMEIVSFVGGG